MTSSTKLHHGKPAASRKPHQGPVFPYRFFFDVSELHREDRPTNLHCNDCFCRWTIGISERPRALEWSDHGKGKGATALSSDEPPRCCSESTPRFYLTGRMGDVAGHTAPGAVYLGLIDGHGWYSSAAGTNFLIRLVTDPDEIPLLREEALFYEEQNLLYSREPPREKNALIPLEYHGFFQTDVGNAAAIVLKSRFDNIQKPRKKKGKKVRRVL